MNCRRPIRIAICPVPNAAIGKLPRTNRQVCVRLHGDLMAKMLAVFPQCEVTRFGPSALLRCNSVAIGVTTALIGTGTECSVVNDQMYGPAVPY